MSPTHRINWPLVLVGLSVAALGWLSLEFEWWRLRFEWIVRRRGGPIRDFLLLLSGVLFVGLGVAGVGATKRGDRTSEPRNRTRIDD